jgi:hypothetical protein
MIVRGYAEILLESAPRGPAARAGATDYEGR